MSAASASAAIGNAQQAAGQSVPAAAAPSTAKKRSVAASKPPPADGLDIPAIPRGKVPRKNRDVTASSANGPMVAEIPPASQSKDYSLGAPHGGEDHPIAKPSKYSSSIPPSGKNSPLKHSARKHSQHRDAHHPSNRKSGSWMQLMSPLFSKFFLIFVVTAGLGSTFWNWRSRPEISHSTGVISTEVEKLEEFVKRTTKWMQVQLEVVDLKIGQEVGDMKRNFQKEMDTQLLHVATEMSNLKDKVDKTGAALDDLFSQGGPLTKKEAFDLVKNAVDRRASEGRGHALSLDDVRTAAKQIVVRELERHSADGIGRVDYALSSAGGKVISHSEGYFLGRTADWWNVVGYLPGTIRRHPMADKVILPSFGEPGQCLPLKGSNVWVDISLRTAIIPDAITLEHVSRENAFDVSSAPKYFRVFGWQEARGQPDRIQNPVTLRTLGEFKYDVEKPSIQTFALAENDVAGFLVNVIRIHVLSNHGSEGHTCIYRVRVHGSNPSLSLTPADE